MAGVAGIATVSLNARLLENAAKGWAIQNEVILEDTGEIINTRLIKEKDRSCSFGDGCNSSFTMQIEGVNGSGELRFSNTFSDSGQLYGAGAHWKWQDESTVIHIESGLSAAEYYSLPNYINVLNDQLASGPFRELTYQRAMIGWVLEDKTQAYEDIRVAIGIREGNKRSIENRDPDLYQPPREDYRVLALFQTFDGNYADALETVELLIASHDEKKRGLANDYVLRWIVQTEAGNQEEANQLLKKTCDALWEESDEDREMVNGIPRFFGGPECGGNLYKGSYEGYLLYSEGKYVEAKQTMVSYIEDIDIAILYDSDVLLTRILVERMAKES